MTRKRPPSRDAQFDIERTGSRVKLGSRPVYNMTMEHVFCTGHLQDGTRFHAELASAHFHGYSDDPFDVFIDSATGSSGVTYRTVTCADIRDVQQTTPRQETDIFHVEQFLGAVPGGMSEGQGRSGVD